MLSILLLLLLSAEAAPTLKVELAGGEEWRKPSTSAVAVDGGDILWIVRGNEVRGLDRQGAVVAEHPTCEAGLYPGGTVALSEDGKRLAVDCGEAYLLSLPDGNPLFHTHSNAGGQVLVPLADGGLATFGQVVDEQGRIALGAYHLRIHDASGRRVLDRADEGLHGLTARPGGLVALHRGSEWSLRGLTAGGEVQWTTAVEPAIDVLQRGDRVCTVHTDAIRCFETAKGQPVASLPLQRQAQNVLWTDQGLVMRLDDSWVRWALRGEPVEIEGLTASALCGWGPDLYDCEPPGIVRFDAAGRRMEGALWGNVDRPVASADAERIAVMDERGRLFVGPIDALTLTGRERWGHVAGVGAEGQLVGSLREGEGSVLRRPDGRLLPLLHNGQPVSVEHLSFSGAEAFGYGYDGEDWAWLALTPDGAVRSLHPEHVLTSVPLARFSRLPDGPVLAQSWDRASLVDVTTGEGRALVRGLERECPPFAREGSVLECEYVAGEGLRMPGGRVFDARLDPSPDGRYVLVMPDGGPVELWDASRGVRLGQLPAGIQPRDIVWTDSGRRFVAVLQDGRVARVTVP